MFVLLLVTIQEWRLGKSRGHTSRWKAIKIKRIYPPLPVIIGANITCVSVTVLEFREEETAASYKSSHKYHEQAEADNRKLTVLHSNGWAVA
jgi:hypothetical protein